MSKDPVRVSFEIFLTVPEGDEQKAEQELWNTVQNMPRSEFDFCIHHEDGLRENVPSWWEDAMGRETP